MKINAAQRLVAAALSKEKFIKMVDDAIASNTRSQLPVSNPKTYVTIVGYKMFVEFDLDDHMDYYIPQHVVLPVTSGEDAFVKYIKWAQKMREDSIKHLDNALKKVLQL